MAKSSICFIAYSFLPKLEAESILNFKILKQLLKNKQLNWKVFSLKSNNTLLEEYSDNLEGNNIEVHYIDEKKFPVRSLLVKFFNSFLLFPDSYILFNKFIKRSIEKHISNIDILFSWSSPHSTTLAALYFKKKFKVPWVAHLSDPWTDSPYNTDRYNILSAGINRYLESYVVENADVLVFTTKETKELCMKKYPLALGGKAKVIPHSYDIDFYPSDEPNNPKLVLRYIGGFYKNRTPLPIFDALSQLNSSMQNFSEKISFELYGPSNIHFNVNKAISKYNLEGIVSYKGSVSYSNSLKLMKTADVLINIDAPADHDIFLTSKVVEYLGAKRPILAISSKNGSTAQFIKEINGDLAEHSEIGKIKVFISDYLIKKNTNTLVLKVSDSVLEKYSSVNIANEYSKILQNVYRKPITRG